MEELTRRERIHRAMHFQPVDKVALRCLHTNVGYYEHGDKLNDLFAALPDDFQPQLSFDGMERTVCDYIAGMTDNYAVDKYTELFIPAGWQVRG